MITDSLLCQHYTCSYQSVGEVVLRSKILQFVYCMVCVRFVYELLSMNVCLIQGGLTLFLEIYHPVIFHFKPNLAHLQFN